MTNLGSILKSIDITLPAEVRLSVKAVVFPVVIYGCESWTIKKAEHQRIDTFELWCWRKLFRVPWTSRRSNQSILEEISPEHSLEGLMLKLKLQKFGRLMWKADSLEKTLTLGKTEGGWRRDDRGWDGWMASPTQWTWVWVNSGSWWKTEGGRRRVDRGWDAWMASPTQWTWVWVNSGSWWWTGRPGVLQSMRLQKVGHGWVTELTKLQIDFSSAWLFSITVYIWMECESVLS